MKNFLSTEQGLRTSLVCRPSRSLGTPPLLNSPLTLDDHGWRSTSLGGHLLSADLSLSSDSQIYDQG